MASKWKGKVLEKGRCIGREDVCVAVTLFPQLLNVEGKVCSPLTNRGSGQQDGGSGEGGCFHQTDLARVSHVQQLLRRSYSHYV